MCEHGEAANVGRVLRLSSLFVACGIALAAPGLAADAGLTPAAALLRTGRYDEARALYAQLLKREPVAAAIGLSRCLSAVGKQDEAIQTLAAVVGKHPEAAAARAELARLEFDRGDYPAAQAQVDAALETEPEEPAARFMAAELHRVAGRLDAANEAYHWLVHFYNSEQDSIRDPEVLRWIGLAGAQYARWNHNAGQFHFLVNTLYPDVLKRDSTYWPAHLETALLFIEKYNRPDAADELKAALAINPHAAELHAARALIALQQFDLDSARAAIDRALAINPRLVVALELRADLNMVVASAREAVPVLERARALNPADEETLGRLAAAYGVIDGLRGEGGSRMGALIAEAVRRNEHCGAFFAALAASLDRLQKYPYAARYYEEARRRMPQLIAVPGQLGLVYMRLGDEAKARESLQQAFEIDPFNVRVKNSLKVLDLLQDYGRIESDHFVVRFDRSRDSLLARYASRYLEQEVYPEIVKKLGFEPRDKSLIEIFGSAKGESGHGWFSARMVGLPFIGTVGACAGKMVAMASPGDPGMSFNWARVLKHEFVHVVNLQQTDFNIPRWFTEALAVHNEGPGTPRVWDQVLARRAASDSLFDLDTINLGFVRPSSGDDWALAYCQSELYVRYMETFGADAPAKMIAAYADNLDTRGALKRSFGLTEEAFEQRYRKYVSGIVAGLGPADTPPPRSPGDLADLRRAAESHPHDAGTLARLARAYLRGGSASQARVTALEALRIDPKQQTAAFVAASVDLSEGDRSRALEALRGAFDAQAPELEALVLLANLTLEAKDYAEAERLALLGERRFPLGADWVKGLAAAYRGTGNHEKLAEVLARRAERDPNDAGLCVELAQLESERKDFEAEARWAREATHIDVANASAHALLAGALSERGRAAQAIDEYETAATLMPEKLEWRLALAKLCATAGEKERARRVLAELIARDANYPGARELLGTLGR